MVGAIIAHANHATGKMIVRNIYRRLAGTIHENFQMRSEGLDFQMIKFVGGEFHGRAGELVPAVVGVTQLQVRIAGADADVIAAIVICTDVRLADAENQPGIAYGTDLHIAFIDKIGKGSCHGEGFGAVG